MKRFSLLATIFLASMLCLPSCSEAPSQKASEDLEEGFSNPPMESRPRIWWHWMNGNITKDGLQKDLQWFNRIGLGGVHIFDAAYDTPQIVKRRVKYMSPQWKELFQMSIAMADSMGMEVAIAASPGWSETGGPWVSKQEAMKKIVWSETFLDASTAEGNVTLSEPPHVAGAFQSIERTGGKSTAYKDLNFYHDIAVLAVKMDDSYSPLSLYEPKVSSSVKGLTYDFLNDEDFTTSRYLPFDSKSDDAWIMYEFEQPQTIYGVTLVGPNSAGRPMGGFAPKNEYTLLEASNDGESFTKVTAINGVDAGVTSVSIPETTARFFRLHYLKPTMLSFVSPFYMEGDESIGFRNQMEEPVAPEGVNVAEFTLHNTPRIDRYILKAAYSNSAEVLESQPTIKGTALSDIIDITDKMDQNGYLSWKPESGKWTILRFGYSLTGHQNSPASPEATGLEVDKLNPDYTRKYFETYLDMYRDAAGGLMGDKGIHYILTDSWEAGAQNWTDNFQQDFINSCGYDMTRWLPAVAGYVVEDSDSSDKFLWDFRKTLSELNVANHYDVLTDVLDEQGLERYTETHEHGRAFTADGMAPKRSAAIPMAAMWTNGWGRSGADIRESASVAHIYGHKYVAAESLTSGSNAWGWSPETLKPTADRELAMGLNRFVLHESAHQPLDSYKPGLTLGPFGQWFSRHETWAEEARPFIDYLSRSSFMLSQGKNVADILYYYGEDTNISAQFDAALPYIPEGFDFDFINSEALLNDVVADHRMISVPSGTFYKVLVLGEQSKKMSLPVLEAIKALVDGGVTVIGPRPIMDPSISDDQKEFETLVNKLWRGKVLDMDIDQAFEKIGLKPDVCFTEEDSDSMLWRHRDFDGVQIYWVNSTAKEEKDTQVTFHVRGLEPEIWNAMTGSIEMAGYQINGDYTTVDIHFDSEDALFVVFRKPTSVKGVEYAKANITSTPVDGSWNVSFNGMGAPKSITMDTLSDLKDNSNPYIRYYAGDIIYTKSINLTSEQIEKGITLNLGEVSVLADIKVNGEDMGTVWKHPFKVDISSAVKEGDNDIEIKVVNLWVNRLIGDQRGDAGHYTHTTQVFHPASEHLWSSGLIGPVMIDSYN